MSVLLISTVAVVCCGVALIVWMYRRDDSRLGMIALAVLIGANILAMVHAGLNASA